MSELPPNLRKAVTQEVGPYSQIHALDGVTELDLNNIEQITSILEDVHCDATRIFTQQFMSMGLAYHAPKFNIRRGIATDLGPCYNPLVETIEVDPHWFSEQFSQVDSSIWAITLGYVVWHETGHHVQKLLGYDPEQIDDPEANVEINLKTVAVELQADCIAGYIIGTKNREDHDLDNEDTDTAAEDAAGIGDDALARHVGMRNIPPWFYTHGTSKERRDAITLGMTLKRLIDVPSLEYFLDISKEIYRRSLLSKQQAGGLRIGIRVSQ